MPDGVPIMPLYEYHCRHCGSTYECLVLSSDEAEPECPCCHRLGGVKLMSAGAVRPQGIATGSGGFKGSACKPSGGG
jgi:putative FmdB family regulatory protein